MPTFCIQAEVTLTYRHTVVADNLAEAIEEVEGSEYDGVEIDSSAPVATYYSIPGKVGWTPIKRDDDDNPIT